MGKKRTLEDVMKALTRRIWNQPINNGSSRCYFVGAPRYKVMGFCNRYTKVVLYGKECISLESLNEVESAVASLIANQPVAGKLLLNGDNNG